MTQIDQILRTSKTSHEALKNLFHFHKERQPEFSLRILGRELGIRSKGHISDMIRGRRSISRKHWSVLSEVFKLSEAQTHYFFCLLEKDHSRNQSQKAYFEKQLTSLESLMDTKIEFEKVEEDQPSKFALEVLDSFKSFKSRPSLIDLVNSFGRHRWLEIENTVDFLLNKGLIEEEDGTFRKVGENTDQEENTTDFLKASIIESYEKLDDHNPEESAFYSEILCVSQEDQKELLIAVQDFVANLKSKSKQGDVNQLVKINVQLYPLGIKI